MGESTGGTEQNIPARSWMVELSLLRTDDPEFASRIPEQRMTVGRLMSAGTIISYTLNADRSKLWTVIIAPEEKDVERILRSFPIISWTRYTVHELFFHEYAFGGALRMSLN